MRRQKKCLVMAPPSFERPRAWSGQCEGERGVRQATKMTSRNIALRRRNNAATDIPFENSFPLEKTSKLAKYRKSHFAALPQFPNHRARAVRFVARKSHTRPHGKSAKIARILGKSLDHLSHNELLLRVLNGLHRQ